MLDLDDIETIVVYGTPTDHHEFTPISGGGAFSGSDTSNQTPVGNTEIWDDAYWEAFDAEMDLIVNMSPSQALEYCEEKYGNCGGADLVMPDQPGESTASVKR